MTAPDQEALDGLKGVTEAERIAKAHAEHERLAREAAKLLNSIPVAMPEAMQAFFAELRNHLHDEVCAQAACEEDRP